MQDFQVLVGLASSIIQTAQLCLQQALREIGLGSAEANVLMFLYTNGDGVRQDDIVTGVDVSKPAISRIVTLLQRKGYVTREQSTVDKRAYEVRLTRKAQETRSFIEGQYAELVNAAKAGVADGQMAEYIQVFRRVAENLENYRKTRIIE